MCCPSIDFDWPLTDICSHFDLPQIYHMYTVQIQVTNEKPGQKRYWDVWNCWNPFITELFLFTHFAIFNLDFLFVKSVAWYLVQWCFPSWTHRFNFIAFLQEVVPNIDLTFVSLYISVAVYRMQVWWAGRQAYRSCHWKAEVGNPSNLTGRLRKVTQVTSQEGKGT